MGDSSSPTSRHLTAPRRPSSPRLRKYRSHPAPINSPKSTEVQGLWLPVGARLSLFVAFGDSPKEESPSMRGLVSPVGLEPTTIGTTTTIGLIVSHPRCAGGPGLSIVAAQRPFSAGSTATEVHRSPTRWLPVWLRRSPNFDSRAARGRVGRPPCATTPRSDPRGGGVGAGRNAGAPPGSHTGRAGRHLRNVPSPPLPLRPHGWTLGPLGRSTRAG